jgi:predicted MPP superfamily phosphohydrolase
MDDPKEKKSSIKTKLLNDFKTIMHTLDEYAHQVEDNINIVDTIALKVRDSHSVSIMKSMEHKLYKIDQILLQCNTYIFLIDESQITISEVLGYKKESKRILN